MKGEGCRSEGGIVSCFIWREIDLREMMTEMANQLEKHGALHRLNGAGEELKSKIPREE